MERDQKLTEDLIKFSEKIGIDIIGFANPKDFERFSEKNRPEAYLKDVQTDSSVFHTHGIMYAIKEQSG